MIVGVLNDVFLCLWGVPYVKRINLSASVAQGWNRNNSSWDLSSALCNLLGLQNLPNIVLMDSDDIPNWVLEDFWTTHTKGC